MTDTAVPPGSERTVLAEWVLSDRDEIRRCSRGTFGPHDFYEIIARYGAGTRDTLPQYTVCWVPGEDGRGQYLAVGIHKLGGPNSVECTPLFCVSYAEMAAQQVSYTELVDSVGGHWLPAGLADPVTVELLSPEPVSFPEAVGALAENVTALLLTTRPVCVLGADQVGPQERLQFIEQVMSLLPYGLRSQMSDSTWASATAKSLKLRLYFAAAERDDSATLHVTWGQPVRLDLSGSARAEPARRAAHPGAGGSGRRANRQAGAPARDGHTTRAHPRHATHQRTGQPQSRPGPDR